MIATGKAASGDVIPYTPFMAQPRTPGQWGFCPGVPGHGDAAAGSASVRDGDAGLERERAPLAMVGQCSSWGDLGWKVLVLTVIWGVYLGESFRSNCQVCSAF